MAPDTPLAPAIQAPVDSMKVQVAEPAVALAPATQAPVDSMEASVAVAALAVAMVLIVARMEPAAARTALTMDPMAYHRRAANEIAPGWMRAPPGECPTQAAKIAEGQQVQVALRKPPAQALVHIASHNRAVAAVLEHSPVEVGDYIVLRFPQKSPKNVFLLDSL